MRYWTGSEPMAGNGRLVCGPVVRSGQDVQLIRLRGIEPTAAPDRWPAWAKEART